jgi:hypothetical protein
VNGPGGTGIDVRTGGDGAFFDHSLCDPYGFGISSMTTSAFGFNHFGTNLDIQPMFVLPFVVSVDQSTPSRSYSALSSAKPSSACSRVLAG